MELDAAIRRRRMCRDFSDRPVPPAVVDRLIDRARRAPSAGDTQGWSFLVLEGTEQTARFWQTDADAAWLADPDHPGLLAAPVIVAVFCSRRAYVERYSRPDKGGADPGAWSAPYWFVDAAFATMLLLLGAEEEGLGALLFRLHGEVPRLRAAFGVPDEWDPVGAVALGWPGDRGGAGAARRPRRRRLPAGEVVHRGGW